MPRTKRKSIEQRRRENVVLKKLTRQAKQSTTDEGREQPVEKSSKYSEHCQGSSNERDVASEQHQMVVASLPHENSGVDVRLHEPLLGREITATDIEIEFMTLCAQMDLLCKKEMKEQPSGKIEHGKVSNSFANKVTVVQDRMQQLLLKDPQLSKQTIGQYMVSKGLDWVFSRTSAYLARPECLNFLDKKTSLDGYLHDISAMNQLLSLATQINSDLNNLTDHKYIAHQLAILYQSVTTVGTPCMEQYKRTIEDNFKVIKAALSSEDDDDRTLCEEHKEWLLNLTCGIVQTITNYPTDLTQEMVQPALVLYNT